MLSLLSLEAGVFQKRASGKRRGSCKIVGHLGIILVCNSSKTTSLTPIDAEVVRRRSLFGTDGFAQVMRVNVWDVLRQGEIGSATGAGGAADVQKKDPNNGGSRRHKERLSGRAP